VAAAGGSNLECRNRKLLTAAAACYSLPLPVLTTLKSNVIRLPGDSQVWFLTNYFKA
jgi:hypothetical protein